MIESHESTTAKLCSFARAYHSTYARKKIFDDSLAFDFMGLEQYEQTGQLIRPQLSGKPDRSQSQLSQQRDCG